MIGTAAIEWAITTWQDSTARIIDYMRQVQARLGPPEADDEADSRRRWVRITTDAYLTTLAVSGGRTGLLVAQRQPCS